MMVVSLFCLFSESFIKKQKREYRHMCDSLSKMDFPPRVLDTLFFRKYGNGIEVDTTFPNGEQHLIQLDYANNYYYAIEYPNIPIIDVMSYDGKDGKLIDWHQRFIDWNNISPWVWYDKEGKEPFVHLLIVWTGRNIRQWESLSQPVKANGLEPKSDYSV